MPPEVFKSPRVNNQQQIVNKNNNNYPKQTQTPGFLPNQGSGRTGITKRSIPNQESPSSFQSSSSELVKRNAGREKSKTISPSQLNKQDAARIVNHNPSVNNRSPISQTTTITKINTVNNNNNNPPLSDPIAAPITQKQTINTPKESTRSQQKRQQPENFGFGNLQRPQNQQITHRLQIITYKNDYFFNPAGSIPGSGGGQNALEGLFFPDGGRVVSVNLNNKFPVRELNSNNPIKVNFPVTATQVSFLDLFVCLVWYLFLFVGSLKIREMSTSR